MMTLKQYLTENRLTQSDFAKMVGVAQPIVSKLCNGASNPGPELARKIQEKTGGAVPFWSWPPYAVFAPDS